MDLPRLSASHGDEWGVFGVFGVSGVSGVFGVFGVFGVEDGWMMV
jgi:hypothetical protein